MAPAGNNKHSQQAMNDTFYLSNIVAQVKIWFRFITYDV
jgi:DNA/RNA endonuclease G (NUC1)